MILLTGGTGLVGSHLLFELMKQEMPVRALIRNKKSTDKVMKTFSLYAKDAQALFAKIEWVDGDIGDSDSLEKALKNVDLIYHCAGKVSFDKRDSSSLLEVNQNGTARLVNAALDSGVKKICHVSSVSALGKTEQGETITENHYWKTSRQNSIYAISKYAAEREIWRGHEEGLDAVVINPSIIIGPGDWNNGSARLFSTIWNGIPAYTNGIGGYVDVRDVARIMVQLVDAEISGQRFIVSSENWSFEDIIKNIANALHKKPPRIKLHPWMGEVGWMAEHMLRFFGRTPTLTKEIARSAFHQYYYDNSKITKALNYGFIPVKNAINDTAEIFLKDHQIK
jgi:nucleoside-diphosphate-sugar epimerase